MADSTVIRLLVVALALLVGRSQQTDECSLVPEHLLSKPHTEWRGRYTNLEYLYSVVIPRGLTAYSGPDGPDGSPQHGFGLAFGSRPQSYILVEGSANSQEWPSAVEAAAADLEYLSDKSRTIESSQVTPARLGTFEAAHLVVYYTCSATRYVFDGTFALIPPRDLVFQLSMWSRRDRYDTDRGVLEQVRRSWKYVPDRQQR